MLQSHHGASAVPEQGIPTRHCSLRQQVLGQDGVLLLTRGFAMRIPAIPPAETGPA